TYFNILAPLSLALRQAIFKVDLASLDSRQNPEVRALEDLKEMAVQLRSHLPELGLKSPLRPDHLQPPNNSASLFSALAEHPEGHLVFDQLDSFLDRYGYLSEVATDIAVPTWRESPQPVRELLTQFLLNPELSTSSSNASTDEGESGEVEADEKDSDKRKSENSPWKQNQVQARLNLKGQVAEVYNRLLANLSSCFVEIESRWLSAGQLDSQGDIFFLTWEDIQRQLSSVSSALGASASPETSSPLDAKELRLKVQLEKTRWQAQGEHRVPYLVYGHQVPNRLPQNALLAPVSSGTLQGIGASAGQIEGTVHVLTNLIDDASDINPDTILVVPYTDAGWSPLLSRIGGLIAEVGGQLSHGAIVAREYGIPAVMDVTDATQKLTSGQRVRIDGQRGTIEIL
ncbi:MAG: PEP-utilizing enzyme, partial [Cyanobacteria bacterium J06632_3]